MFSITRERTLQEEIDLVESSGKTKLLDKDVWQVINADWFRKWRKYVSFADESSGETNEFFPGEIDNTNLKGEVEEVLKQGLQENEDYILVTNNAAEYLFHKYKGGPKFPRRVVCSNPNGIIKEFCIDLFPVPVRAFDCNKKQVQVPDSFRSTTASRREDLVSFLSTYKNVTLRKYMGVMRAWIKSPLPPDDSNSGGRMLTREVTDRDGSWLLVRNNNVRMNDLLGDKPFLELVLEHHEENFTSKEDKFPRAPLLNKWREDIRVGDVLDCSDSKGAWYESVVLRVGEDGVFVHFKGWADKFDELIPKAKLISRTSPLYTETKNWRSKLVEDSHVDFNVAEEGQPSLWVVARVDEVDEVRGAIKLFYRITSKTNSNKSKNENMEVECDDDKKKETEDVVEATQWVNLQSEKLCNLYVHTHMKQNTFINQSTSNSSSSFTLVNKDSDSVVGSSVSSVMRGNNALSSVSARRERDSDDYYYGDKSVAGKPPFRGVVGLQNLGNTCFMNSVLQCLSNTYPLTEYFLNNNSRFKDELNKDNVLGSGGKLAVAYAVLMREMWSDSYVKVVPRGLKKVIGDIQPQFAGYQQQDNQELMAFLLDGLHEDLNRVLKKPAVSKVESGGRPDELVSREAWRRFLLRNDSELVDKFHGQLRSHVTCSCGKESVTFDEFNILNLPIPVKTTKPLTVVFRSLNPASRPLKISLEVEVFDKIGDVLQKLVTCLQKAGKLEVFEPKGESSSPIVEEEEDGYMKITTEKTSRSVDSRYSKEAYETREMALSRGDRLPPALHIASFQFNRFKNLTEKNPVNDFLNSREPLFLFQLAHPAIPKIPSYSYSSYSPHSSNSIQQEEPFVTYVDLVVGYNRKMSSYSNYTSVALSGSPIRFNITRETTGRQIYNTVWSLLSKFIKGTTACPNPESLSDVPCKICLFSYPVLRGDIECNDEVVQIGSDYSILLFWNTEQEFEECFDSQAFDYYEFLNIDESGEIEESNLDKNSVGSDKRAKHSLNIFSCLDKYCEREQLNQEETLFCSQCKQHVAPLKKMDLWATPDTLIVLFNRFQNIPGQYYVHRQKIVDFIDFPVTGLDLTAYVKGPQSAQAPPIYDLYAVSLHSGSMGGGHYTAVCKNPLNQQWYNFNDSYVSETSPETAVCEQAYVLFYQRRQGKQKWAGIVPLEAPGLSDV